MRAALRRYEREHMNVSAGLLFIGAALLEVGGDAVIRKGLRNGSLFLILTGFIMLGLYGVVVNTVNWDFSRLLGVYIAFFAVVSVVFGGLVFQERVPMTTWIGLIVICAGAMLIQFGAARGL